MSDSNRNSKIKNHLQLLYNITDEPTVYDGYEYGYIYWGLDENDEIIYIGKTGNFQSRLASHPWLDPEKHKIYYTKVPKEELSDIECDLILEFTPKFNGTLPKSDYFITLEQYQKEDIRFYHHKVKYLNIINKNNIKNRFGYFSRDDLDFASAELDEETE